MKKTICIVTATRAEWGLLRPLAQAIKDDASFNLKIIATGTHFLDTFGNTANEIIADGFPIDERVDILNKTIESGNDVSKSMATALSGFADVFSRNKYDLIILLGDRYETLAVALAAMNAKIPILHISGGDVTEGAIDDAIRHSISKLSYLHCTSCEEYRKRVIQLGESPDRVYNTGAIGIDNIRTMHLLSKEELAKILYFDITEKPYAVITFHPETLNNTDVASQCKELLKAISEFPDMQFIITKSNADEGAAIVNKMMEEYAYIHRNVLVVSSLGNLRYLSTLKHAKMIIGNSSSGISEAPYLKIPTINIGIRQKGRIQANTIINCDISTEKIVSAMNRALSSEFLASIKNTEYPYGNGHAAEKILAVIHEWLDYDKIDLKKEFYNLKVEL